VDTDVISIVTSTAPSAARCQMEVVRILITASLVVHEDVRQYRMGDIVCSEILAGITEQFAGHLQIVAACVTTRLPDRWCRLHEDVIGDDTTIGIADAGAPQEDTVQEREAGGPEKIHGIPGTLPIE